MRELIISGMLKIQDVLKQNFLLEQRTVYNIFSPGVKLLSLVTRVKVLRTLVVLAAIQSVDEILKCDRSNQTTKQYFSVMMFITPYMVVLTFETG